MTWLACAIGLALVLTGCQRLNVEKEWKMQSGDTKMVIVDAPRGEQKVDVKVTASEPVDVYVLKQEQVKEFNDKQTFERGKAITVRKDVKSETISTTVPGGAEFGVAVVARKAANVKVNIEGR
jgi:hypothetical protein